MIATLHNPDRFMIDLRQILSQGRKRIGLLIGAGAPTALKVNDKNELHADGEPIIPDATGLTSVVLDALPTEDKEVLRKATEGLGEAQNVELILTKIRKLQLAIGGETVFGLNGEQYEQLAERICSEIGKVVSPTLPEQPNPYTELISWISGTHREYAVEIFTPNYDLLLEEAFEQGRRPYFDGFSGSTVPFFDSASIENDELPSSWTRLWKLHGSLGWEVKGDSITRTGDRGATSLIFPDHLKYDLISRQPYTALFDRLRNFLETPDTVLITCGFSFFDSHISSVIEESLAKNNHTAVLAFQFKDLEEEKLAVDLALLRPNLSVYARDGAVVFGIQGNWSPGEPPTEEWAGIRQTFWHPENRFLLGDFALLARFLSLTQARAVASNEIATGERESEDNNVK